MGLMLLWLGGPACTRYEPLDSETGGSVVVVDTSDTSVDTGTPPDTTIDPRIALEPVSACSDPAPTPTYVEVGATWGLLGAERPDPDEKVSGGALAVWDVDRDGDLDIAVGFKSENVVLYRNEGGASFTHTALEGIGSLGTALNVGDMDGDGWEDLIIGKPPSIVRNIEGQLEADALVMLEDVDQESSVELSPGDIDGDGQLDLYSVVQTNDDEPHEDGLFLNRGDLGFDEVPNGVPDDPHDGKGFDVVWFDVDLDGDVDAYVSNDIGNIYGENVLWRNDDGVLVDGNDACGCGVVMTGMGVDVGDADRDGNMDLFLAHGSGQVLLKGLGGGVFYDATDVSGASIPDMSWGSVFFDRDNDGDQDILVAKGDWLVDGAPNGEPGDGVGLLEQADDGTFADAGPALGLESTSDYRSVVAADFNADGVLDIVAADVQLRPQVYLSESCTDDAWLEVWAPPETRVVVTAGPDQWVDEVMNDSGRGAAGPAMVHFGLGAHTAVSRIELILPGGERVVAEGVIDARRVVRYAP